MEETPEPWLIVLRAVDRRRAGTGGSGALLCMRRELGDLTTFVARLSGEDAGDGLEGERVLLEMAWEVLCWICVRGKTIIENIGMKTCLLGESARAGRFMRPGEGGRADVREGLSTESRTFWLDMMRRRTADQQRACPWQLATR